MKKRKAEYLTELTFIDKTTGAKVKTPALVLGQEPTYIDTQTHVKIFVTFLQDLVIDKKVTKGAIRLLLYMLNHLSWNNLEITLIPNYAMKDLNISNFTFYQWLNTLLDKGIIKKIDKFTYELIPYSAIKGSQEIAFIEKEKKEKRRP